MAASKTKPGTVSCVDCRRVLSRHNRCRDFARHDQQHYPPGPDAGDTWCDGAAGMGLPHRRLSILDLSPAGAQPMHSKDGRGVIVFNGEIYNFAVLRADLEKFGASFVGHSNTEVLLGGFFAWGVEATLRRTNGRQISAHYAKALHGAIANYRLVKKALLDWEVEPERLIDAEQATQT